MNVGICKVNPSLLVEALHMPEGTVIDNAQWDIHSGQLWLRVNHPDLLNTSEGYPMYEANLAITCFCDVESPDRVARRYKGEWK
jgi:hypothetical protein